MVTNTIVSRNAWHHYVRVSTNGSTVDGTNYLKIFIDGNVVYTGSSNAATVQSGYGFCAGGTPPNGGQGGYYIDNYRIYNYCMTSAQVSELYAYQSANPKL